MEYPDVILLDATPLQSEHRFRGVGTYVRHLCRALVAMDPDRIVFALARRPLDGVDADIRTRAVYGTRGHRPAQVYWIYNELFLRRAIRLSQPSLFHAPDFNGLVLTPGVPTVATLHDLIPLERTPSITPGPSARLSAWRWQVYWGRLQRATAIIAVSQHVKREAIERLHIEPSKITVIYPGVNTDSFRPADPATLTEPPYFLMVGTLEPHKNVGAALTAFARLHQDCPTVRLKMAGTWREGGKAWLERQCRALGIGGYCDLLGHVSARELLHLYQRTTAFLFPSLDEGFGSPLVEAMACGAAVVTSRYGAPAEVVGDAGLQVDPHQPDALYQAMKAVLNRDELRASLKARARPRALTFGWEAAARRTWAVYEDVLATSRT